MRGWRGVGLRVPPIMKTNNRRAFCFDKSNNFYIKAGPRGHEEGTGLRGTLDHCEKDLKFKLLK